MKGGCSAVLPSFMPAGSHVLGEQSGNPMAARPRPAAGAHRVIRRSPPDSCTTGALLSTLFPCCLNHVGCDSGGYACGDTVRSKLANTSRGLLLPTGRCVSSFPTEYRSRASHGGVRVLFGACSLRKNASPERKGPICEIAHQIPRPIPLHTDLEYPDFPTRITNNPNPLLRRRAPLICSRFPVRAGSRISRS